MDKPPRPRREPAQLTEDAWAALDELTHAGVVTLPGGAVLAPEPKVVIDVFKWLANLRGKPTKVPKAMDNWQPRESKL